MIGAEVFTRILDWQDRSTCVLFGDGAGAVVLQPTTSLAGLLSFVLGSDGVGRVQPVRASGRQSRGRRRPRRLPQREHYVKMQGREVFRFADARGARLGPAGARAGRPDHRRHRPVHPAPGQRAHHRRGREAAEAADRAVFANVEHYGNTSAASVPWRCARRSTRARVCGRHGRHERLRGRLVVGHRRLEVALSPTWSGACPGRGSLQPSSKISVARAFPGRGACSPPPPVAAPLVPRCALLVSSRMFSASAEDGGQRLGQAVRSFGPCSPSGSLGRPSLVPAESPNSCLGRTASRIPQGWVSAGDSRDRRKHDA